MNYLLDKYTEIKYVFFRIDIGEPACRTFIYVYHKHTSKLLTLSIYHLLSLRYTANASRGVIRKGFYFPSILSEITCACYNCLYLLRDI